MTGFNADILPRWKEECLIPPNSIKGFVNCDSK